MINILYLLLSIFSLIDFQSFEERKECGIKFRNALVTMVLDGK
jgi:hypothetical protein